VTGERESHGGDDGGFEEHGWCFGSGSGEYELGSLGS
jgi:hypothetical protein